MRLTPIKIRGKGPRKKGFKPPRPDRIRQASGKRKKKPPAPLEQLPLEILQRVFLLSANLAFPRSSVRIGYHLSARSFLLELFVLAFSPTWDVWFGRTRGADGDVDGDPDFQSDVLASPWATLPLILDAQQMWWRRQKSAYSFEHLQLGCVPWTVNNNNGNNTAQPCCVPLPPGCPRHETDGPSVHGCFEADWQRFASPHEAGCRRAAWETTYVGVHPAVRVPEELLARPDSREKARRLFWLRSNGARGEGSSLGDWEVTKQGFDSVMGEKGEDETALLVLQLFDSWDVFGSDWPAHVREEAAAYVESRLRSAGHRLPRACQFARRVLNL